MPPALTRDAAEKFAREWVQAWNDKDLDAILSHYADDVVFHSPRIAQVLQVEQSSVKGLEALRDYWSASLESVGDIYFEIERILLGSDALTLLYTNRRGQYVAESFLFNEAGKVKESLSAYE